MDVCIKVQTWITKEHRDPFFITKEFHYEYKESGMN